MRCIRLIPLVLILGQQPGSAQENPVVLYKGLGTWRHAIHTTSAEAQKFFDQGLALTYGFNRYEALRSFRKASELDPQAAMPYWGMAMAQGPYVNMDGDAEFNMKASCAAAEAGLKVAGAPEEERAYLQAAAVRCPEYQPEPYIKAMRELANRWPDDLDALTFYAESLLIPPRWHWYSADGTPAAGVLEAEHTLEQVLRRWPDHPGANHLYIHAVESSPTPERAIASAQRLKGGDAVGGAHGAHARAYLAGARRLRDGGGGERTGGGGGSRVPGAVADFERISLLLRSQSELRRVRALDAGAKSGWSARRR